MYVEETEEVEAALVVVVLSLLLLLPVDYAQTSVCVAVVDDEHVALGDHE